MKLLPLIALLAIQTTLFAQHSGAPAYNGSYNFNTGDPARDFNKYMVTREDRAYTQIGAFKVIGSPYLFGPRHLGTIYGKGEMGTNIYISYNTYNQDLEYYTTATAEEPLIKEAGTVDSFTMKKDSLVQQELRFVYSTILGATEKGFYMQIVKGGKYSLYKRYKSSLGFVSTNYIDGNLRQFDLDAEYYYFDEKNKQLKKLKPNTSFLKKEFQLKSLDGYTTEEEMNYNKEDGLKSFFFAVNKN